MLAITSTSAATPSAPSTSVFVPRPTGSLAPMLPGYRATASLTPVAAIPSFNPQPPPPAPIPQQTNPSNPNDGVTVPNDTSAAPNDPSGGGTTATIQALPVAQIAPAPGIVAQDGTTPWGWIAAGAITVAGGVGAFWYHSRHHR